jgi:hypothetical protein
MPCLALVATLLSTVACTTSDHGRPDTAAAKPGATSATPQTDRTNDFPLIQVSGAEKGHTH